MAHANIGDALKREVHATKLARLNGRGFAVFAGEEDDVRVILGTPGQARARAARIGSDTGASTYGFYAVRRDNDGRRWRVARD